MTCRISIFLRLLVFAISALLLPSTANAHFNLNLNVRIIHVEHLSDGMKIYMRLPMPYLVAHLLGDVDAGGLPEPAPYTTNRIEDGKLVHYVDAEQLKRSAEGLASLARDGLVLTGGGNRMKLSVERILLYPNGTQPDFATLEEAQKAFLQTQSFTAIEEGIYVGDTTVDVLLRYSGSKPLDEYALSSSLNPGLPDQDQTANLLLDYSPGNVQVFRIRGLLQDPVTVTNSVFDALMTFIGEGVKHILEGLDHVLFVICLVLGAMHIKPLLWRVTGFTIGHSITLSLGFFGFVPSAAWFVPAVETGIALSIIYVAIVAVLPDFNPRFKSEKSEWTVIGITSLIGLLHGLGFSFVLQKILQVTSPNIWQSLLAFNLGVEVGQVLIVIITIIVFYMIGMIGQRATQISRYLITGSCTTISLFWVIERSNSILSNI
jgi:hypothetical protein